MTEQEFQIERAKSQTEQDQEWRHGVQWVLDSDEEITVALLDQLQKDDSPGTLKAISEGDPRVAEVVCRLATVALKEIFLRMLDQAEDGLQPRAPKIVIHRQIPRTEGGGA